MIHLVHKSLSVLFCFTLLTTFYGCINNDDLNQAVNEVNACARLHDIEVDHINAQIDQNFFHGTLNEVVLGTKEGFKDYSMKVGIGSIFVTEDRGSGGEVLNSYRQLNIRLSSEGASGEVFVGSPLLSVIVKLPCERSADSTALSIYKHSLLEGSTYNISSNTSSDCEENVDITVHPLCHNYNSAQRGSYTGKPFSSVIGKQDDHQFVVDKYRLTNMSDGGLRFELRAFFSANLYYNTPQGGPIPFGVLKDAVISIDKVVYL